MNTLGMTLALYVGPTPPPPSMFPDPYEPRQMYLWMIVGLVLLCVAVMRTLKPIRRGCCLWCGYSLAGIGERAVCPECGKARQA